MRNKVVDLNNHLFEQLERLNDDELSAEDLEKEVHRTESMVQISKVIIENERIQLEVAQLMAEYGRTEFVPENLMIEDKK